MPRPLPPPLPPPPPPRPTPAEDLARCIWGGPAGASAEVARRPGPLMVATSLLAWPCCCCCWSCDARARVLTTRRGERAGCPGVDVGANACFLGPDAVGRRGAVIPMPVPMRGLVRRAASSSAGLPSILLSAERALRAQELRKGCTQPPTTSSAAQATILSASHGFTHSLLFAFMMMRHIIRFCELGGIRDGSVERGNRTY